jgi:hypothetical protein
VQCVDAALPGEARELEEKKRVSARAPPVRVPSAPASSPSPTLAPASHASTLLTSGTIAVSGVAVAQTRNGFVALLLEAHGLGPDSSSSVR